MKRTIFAELRLLPRQATMAAGTVAAAMISGALFFQYGLGILPCELCLLQRIPYYVALPIALLSSLLPNRSMTIRLGLVILALIFICGAGIAAYHAGVEWKWWPGPTGCSGDAAALGNATDLLAQMQQTKVISCSEASWRFLGLSLAGWNVLISIGLATLMLLPLRRKKIS